MIAWHACNERTRRVGSEAERDLKVWGVDVRDGQRLIPGDEGFSQSLQVSH